MRANEDDAEHLCQVCVYLAALQGSDGRKPGGAVARQRSWLKIFAPGRLKSSGHIGPAHMGKAHPFGAGELHAYNTLAVFGVSCICEATFIYIYMYIYIQIKLIYVRL